MVKLLSIGSEVYAFGERKPPIYIEHVHRHNPLMLPESNSPGAPSKLQYQRSPGYERLLAL
jgi:hypothetical protein